MTDVEITKLCAEAMGWKHLGAVGVPVPPEDKRDRSGLWCRSGANDWWINPEGETVCGPCVGIPDPLHDDAQAMALVKKFDLEIGRPWDRWTVTPVGKQRLNYELHTSAPDLNRAICECVSQMKKAK